MGFARIMHVFFAFVCVSFAILLHAPITYRTNKNYCISALCSCRYTAHISASLKKIAEMQKLLHLCISASLNPRQLEDKDVLAEDSHGLVGPIDQVPVPAVPLPGPGTIAEHINGILDPAAFAFSKFPDAAGVP